MVFCSPRHSDRIPGLTLEAGLDLANRLSEHISRPDFNTLKYEVTIDDPGAYTKVWSSSWNLKWISGEELPIYYCQDNRP